jgi:hypothetical protein
VVETPQQHSRDVLRVCTLLEMRRAVDRPFTARLAIPVEVDAFMEQATLLSALFGADRSPV